MLTSQVQVTVRYAETDMMGVVYHASYLPWLEIGRTTLLREHGLPYRMLEEMGYRLPVLEISAKYLRPAVYDDTVTIFTTMREKPILRLVLDYEVRRLSAAEDGPASAGSEGAQLGGTSDNSAQENAKGELLATARSIHAFIDKEGRPTRPPALFVEKMNAAFGA
ncbi:acyl-CoA thioester hydrolase [Cephaloticoccus capnophilus]|uniref:Acyl-CoA thioester hydrolase n=1 Tax=Cephaloticoccus capnophilus TaxID=1548208 RepID=A0A139SP40_9BACT|nr:thioesterase family protein [Cephaloticoccus capnophilus]KXU36348.1 acyl-CoA thioester hydrolase [Cephaloticoccus capnophilus]